MVLLWTVLILSTLCQALWSVPKYVFHNVSTSSLEAETTCLEVYKTHLASIHSEQDNAEAQELCDHQSSDDRPGCWIGLHDFHSEAGDNGDAFIWYDGTPLDFTNWGEGEPNNYYGHSGGEDLVDIIAETGQWNDELNGRRMRLICWNPDYTRDPTNAPTITPSSIPTAAPTYSPTLVPTHNPTIAPTVAPTYRPTLAPTHNPTSSPTADPTSFPTIAPTIAPTYSPTLSPTLNPTYNPTSYPTASPTSQPTSNPTVNPTTDPTNAPTTTPTEAPSDTPTFAPTAKPTLDKEVEEETTNSMIATHDEVAPKKGDEIHSTFVEANSTTIVYTLAVLLLFTCIIMIILCYTERRRIKGDKAGDLHAPLLDSANDEDIALPCSNDNMYGECEGVELTKPNLLINHTLSSIVNSTASLESSEDEDSNESDLLYHFEDHKQRNTFGNTKGNNAKQYGVEKQISSDSLYEHDAQITMKDTDTGDTFESTKNGENAACEHVLQTPMQPHEK